MDLFFLKEYSEKLAKDMVKTLSKSNVKELKGNGTFEVVATTEGVDRDGEIILIDGWDFANFMKNPVILLSHNYSNLPIGAATEVVKEDKRIIVRGVFANTEDGQEVRQLYDDGILKTVSVGFIPKERTQNVITKAELLELSFVSVPANPDAMTLEKTARLVKFNKKFNLKETPNLSQEGQQSDNAASTETVPEGVVTEADQKAALKARLLTMEKLIDDLSSIKDHYLGALEIPKPEVKAGRVLSSKNHELVTKAIEALQALLDAAEPDKTVSETAIKELVTDAQTLQGIVERVIRGSKALKSNI